MRSGFSDAEGMVKEYLQRLQASFVLKVASFLMFALMFVLEFKKKVFLNSICYKSNKS